MDRAVTAGFCRTSTRARHRPAGARMPPILMLTRHRPVTVALARREAVQMIPQHAELSDRAGVFGVTQAAVTRQPDH